MTGAHAFGNAFRNLLLSIDGRKERIAVWKDILATLQSLATVIALIIGGIWTYRVFIEQRQTNPRLKVEHKFSQHALPSGETLLSVDELLSNSGSVLLAVKDAETRVVQVLPLPVGTAKFTQDVQGVQGMPDLSRAPDIWPVIKVIHRQWKAGEKVLEPGEDDQLHSEFILARDIKTIAVVSYLTNPSDPKLGWHRITLCDISESPSAEGVKPKQTGRQSRHN